MSQIDPLVQSLTKCKHAERKGARPSACCLDWPSPDGKGRRHCLVCGCFTASPEQVHSWCIGRA